MTSSQEAGHDRDRMVDGDRRRRRRGPGGVIRALARGRRLGLLALVCAVIVGYPRK
jgi:hypothetical protein